MAWQAPPVPPRPRWPAGLPGTLPILLALLLVLPPASPAAPAAGRARGGFVQVIVRERVPGQAARRVRQLGGTVVRALPLVGGFAARVPAGRVPQLLGSPAVLQVWPDARVRVRGLAGDAAAAGAAPPGGWHRAIHLDGLGRRGQRATVALLDTGVSPTPDLGGRLLARVDLTEEHDGFDRYGHGSHLSGVIAGDGEMADGRPGGARGGGYEGAAPAARLVSVKVANGSGATDVSVVLAGLQWVVSHRDQYHIDVLNLSFGTDATQSYLLDPLDFAVERAWRAGILVVVAAGNDGEQGPGAVSKPGDDPFVLTVGAADLKDPAVAGDDVVAPFSSFGPTADGVAKPDLVAPGTSILGVRAAGSTVDRLHPTARVGGSYLKGTGTSQAAAIVSGVAALLYDADATLRPDVAKAALVRTAQRQLAGQPGAGAGLVDARAAVEAVRRGTFEAHPANQGLRRSTGLGSIEASRGSQHAYTDLDGDGATEPLAGELDALGRAWDAPAWTATPWTRPAWSRSPWSRLAAEAPGWELRRWDGDTWPGLDQPSGAWTVKHWGGRFWNEFGQVQFTWLVKHWGAATWQVVRWGGPRPEPVEHWGTSSWS
ncbi:MAG TPA: S8 family serine peptidase [Actinomycetota bacterium]|jgi:serine protease AprX